MRPTIYLSPTSIIPLNPTTPSKVNNLKEQLTKEGWQGPPLIVLQAHPYYQALNGSHRLLAALQLQIMVPCIIITKQEAPDLYRPLTLPVHQAYQYQLKAQEVLNKLDTTILSGATLH